MGELLKPIAFSLLGVAAAASALSACSEDSQSVDPSSPSVSSTTTLEPSPTEPAEDADPFAPNVGDRALRVGETRMGRDIRTTVLKVNYPLPKADFMVGPYRVKEYDRVDFVGLRIKQCLRPGAEVDAAAPVYSSYNGEF